MSFHILLNHLLVLLQVPPILILIVMFYSGLAKQDQEEAKTALRDVSPFTDLAKDATSPVCHGPIYVVAPGFDRLHR